MIFLPFDSSRQQTTLTTARYLVQLPLDARPGVRGWVHRALLLRVVDSRADVGLVNRIWLQRHYLGCQPTAPRVKRLSYLGEFFGVAGGDAAAAVAFTVALQPSGSTIMRQLRSQLGLHPCEILELVRCWRADDLSPRVAPDLMPYALRRLVAGGNGVAGLEHEWSARKLTGGLTARPKVLLTYADPQLGHDGGLYRGAGAVYLGRTGTGKLAFGWALDSSLNFGGRMHLTLVLKQEYFDLIRAGRKLEEYRLVCPYWERRLEGRTFSGLTLLCGYASRQDQSKRLSLPWYGCERRTICHPHFGPLPVEVYAIRLTPPGSL